jgi:hypothetical protein
LTFNVTGIAQALTQRLERRRSRVGKAWMKKSDDRHLSSLLRLPERRQRDPCARQNHDEIASTHVMTCRQSRRLVSYDYSRDLPGAKWGQARLGGSDRATKPA